MNIVATFDPTNIMSDTFTVPASSGDAHMVVYNESNVGLQIMFQNGYSAYLPPWLALLLPSPYGATTISWEQYTVLNSAKAPVSEVIVELYACGETIPGVYPVSLLRQVNVGNAIIT